MRIPELDQRTREDILQTFASKIKGYTPEWRFDPRDPDLGTALAMIYSDLFSQTVRRFNRVPEKNLAAFFSSIGTGLLPAVPAEGFVRFGLSGDSTERAAIPAGTQLMADADNESGSTVFETLDDVLVTAAVPREIFSVCGEQDAIVRNYSGGEESFPLFDYQSDNIQSHALYLSHPYMLDVTGGAELSVELTPSHQRELPREIGAALADPEKAVWEYSYNESWQPFSSCESMGNEIRLKLAPQKLPILPLQTETEENLRWIRVRLQKGTVLPELTLRLIRISARNERLLPDLVHSDGADQDVHEFAPFGQQLGVFSEAYFGCREALMKRGAQVEMTFNLDFVPVPLEYDQTAAPINWKLIMKKSQFKVDEAYDVTVQQVIWEYFNGNGWARLFPDDREADCFDGALGALGQRKTLRFSVPEDIREVLVNSETGYFIRARVLNVKNLYKLKGRYIVPVMEGLRFSYCCEGKGKLPEKLVTENELERQYWDSSVFKNGTGMLEPFRFLRERYAAVVIGFDLPPVGGPVKMLFRMEETLRGTSGRLRWEYRSNKGWESLNTVDETENLCRTGVLTLMVDGEIEKTQLFGRSYYWIRAVDAEKAYAPDRDRRQLPRVNRIYMNGVRVRNTAAQPPERFLMEQERKNFKAELQHDRIWRAEVWVDEAETLTRQEQELLREQGDLRLVRSPDGTVLEAWVRWKEQEDFALSGPADRHYVLDRNRGTVQFSDGVSGRIPPARRQESIEVRCSTGGGAEGNVPAGAINRAQQSLGVVSLIENPMAAAGGCDQETISEALKRGSDALRHGGRAVTERDFEDLALEATRAIEKVRCFANRNAEGTKQPGAVTLVVLLKEYQAGGELQNSVCNLVKDYVGRRCGGNLAALGQLNVIPAQLLELRVKVELTVRNMNEVFQVRERVEDRLRAFLDPVSGNFDSGGWPVGRIPNDTQLRNCLSSVLGKTTIRSISSAAFAESGFGRTEVAPEALEKMPYILPYSGEHHILITVEP